MLNILEHQPWAQFRGMKNANDTLRGLRLTSSLHTVAGEEKERLTHGAAAPGTGLTDPQRSLLWATQFIQAQAPEPPRSLLWSNERKVCPDLPPLTHPNLNRQELGSALPSLQPLWDGTSASGHPLTLPTCAPRGWRVKAWSLPEPMLPSRISM